MRWALALDGMATGRVTDRGAAELVERLRAAGVGDDDAVAELLASLGVERPPMPSGAASSVPTGQAGASVGAGAERVTPEVAAAEAAAAHAGVEAAGPEVPDPRMGPTEPTVHPGATEPEVRPATPDAGAAGVPAPGTAAAEAAASEPATVDHADLEQARPAQAGAEVAAPGAPVPVPAPSEEIAVPDREREAAAPLSGAEAVTTDGPQTAVPAPVTEPGPPVPSWAPEPRPPAAEEAAAAPAEPALVGVAPPVEPTSVPAGNATRRVPLPGGEPQLARLSSAFTDTPRLLRRLAADRYTGVVELSGGDGRTDAIVLLEGRCLATLVEEDGRRADRPLRLPALARGPLVRIDVRPHAASVVVTLALALRAPAVLSGMHASFVHLPGLARVLGRDGADAACVVSSPEGSGVVLVSSGEPVAAYARRRGERPGDAAERADVAAVARLLAGGEGEVDVHRGAPPVPYDLDDLIAASQAV